MTRRLILTAIVAAILLPNTLRADGENSVLLLDDRTLAAQVRLDTKLAARKEIRLSTFILKNDDVGLGTLAVLRERAREGVRVRLLVDATQIHVPLVVLAHLEAEGVEIRRFNPAAQVHLNPLNYTRRLHDKALISDDAAIVLGDSNLGNEYYGFGKKKITRGSPMMRSREIYVEGLVAADAAAYFDWLWKQEKWVRPLSRKKFFIADLKAAERKLSKFLAQVRKSPTLKWDRASAWRAGLRPVEKATFLHDPIGAKGKAEGVHEDLLKLVRQARKSIRFETPYMVFPADLQKEIRAAVERGVRVQLVTNSFLAGDHEITKLGHMVEAQRNVNLGLELHEYIGPETNHVKGMIVDDRIAYVGSSNFDTRSKGLDTQVGVVIEDAPFVRDLSKRYDDTLAVSLLVGKDGRLLFERTCPPALRAVLFLLRHQL